MQFGNTFETLATSTVDAVLACLIQVKLTLLTTILLLSAEWLPTGWKRRRVIAVCVVAMSVDLLGTAAVQVLADVAAEPAGKATADSSPRLHRPDRSLLGHPTGVRRNSMGIRSPRLR